jgi:hypothetical protein
MKSSLLPLINVFGTFSLCAVFLWCGTLARAAEGGLDAAKIEAITGLKGARNETENTFKVSKPRNDVPVTIDQAPMAPFMGLTSWATFMEGGKADAMVMGDMVLFEDEVNPVMSAALDHGLEVTALHNHFFFDHPKVYFMHIGGEGTVQKLAEGVRAIFDKEKEIRAANREPADSFGSGHLPSKSSIDAEPISQVFGQKGDAKDGMYKVVIGREVKMACGCTVGNTMGVNTWAAFAGTPDDALVVGDFAVLENELQTVLKTLRGANINIVAIHQHMTGETPRMMFLHYYGRGKALTLAQGVKSAINTQPLAVNN